MASWFPDSFCSRPLGSGVGSGLGFSALQPVFFSQPPLSRPLLSRRQCFLPFLSRLRCLLPWPYLVTWCGLSSSWLRGWVGRLVSPGRSLASQLQGLRHRRWVGWLVSPGRSLASQLQRLRLRRWAGPSCSSGWQAQRLQFRCWLGRFFLPGRSSDLQVQRFRLLCWVGRNADLFFFYTFVELLPSADSLPCYRFAF